MRNKFGNLSFRIRGKGGDWMLCARSENAALEEAARFQKCSVGDLQESTDFSVEVMTPEFATEEFYRILRSR